MRGTKSKKLRLEKLKRKMNPHQNSYGSGATMEMPRSPRNVLQNKKITWSKNNADSDA